jgi:hypothetical protein
MTCLPWPWAYWKAGEKRKEEDSEDVLGRLLSCGIDVTGPSDIAGTPNKEISDIVQELEEITANGHGDAFTLYLYTSFCIAKQRLGTAQIRNHKAEDAFRPLLLSIDKNPYIWGSWQELSSIITSTKTVCSLDYLT